MLDTALMNLAAKNRRFSAVVKKHYQLKESRITMKESDDTKGSNETIIQK